MPAARFIRLTAEEDDMLRKMEQNPQLRAKVRQRSQVLRLSNQGWKVRQIAAYTGRSDTSIGRDFDRWERGGVAGLADSSPPGNSAIIGDTARAFLCECLAEERTWNALQLADALAEQLKVRVDAETIRRHLHEMNYSWKRTRYVPTHAPDPQAEHAARAALETLKRGRKQDVCA
jgi:transposase